MKKFLTLLACASILFACDDDTTKPVTVPTVSSISITAVTLTTATATGEVTNSGGDNVTERGFVLATTENPTIDNTKVTSGTGTGAFTTELTELLPETTYYVRAYAINSKGVAYGDQLSFETEPIESATLQTTEAEDISFTSAYVSGEVLNNGGGTITEFGIVWATTQNPTNESNKVVAEEATANQFSVALTGLPVGTTIYARAFATNAAGTAYGNQISFITTALTNPIEHFEFSSNHFGDEGGPVIYSALHDRWLQLFGYEGAFPLGPDRYGNANASLAFDGVDDYANNANYQLEFNGSNELSISMWVKLNTNVQDYSLLLLSNQNFTFGAFGFTNDLKAIIYGIDSESFGTFLLNDSWKQLTLIYKNSNDNTLVSLYINGELIGTKSVGVTPVLPGNFNFSIGSTELVNLNFPGSIDDVKIYNIALSADEIVFIYEQEKP